VARSSGAIRCLRRPDRARRDGSAVTAGFDRTVSRFHAHVSCSGETYFLEEMGSRNTATVNGKAVKAGSKEALRRATRYGSAISHWPSISTTRTFPSPR